MAYREEATATDRLASMDQLRQIRNRLREQHEVEMAEAAEVEETARRKRATATETGKIVNGMDALEEALTVEAKKVAEYDSVRVSGGPAGPMTVRY